MKLIEGQFMDATKILVLESDRSDYYSPQCNKFFKRLSGKSSHGWFYNNWDFDL